MNVVNKFLGLKKNNRNAYFFFAVMCVFLVMFFIGCIISTCAYGKQFFVNENVFWLDGGDWFMDFFNVNGFVKNMDPYIAEKSSYPPLVLLIAKLFSLCADYSVSSRAARVSVGGIISLLFFLVIFFVVSLILLRKICKKHGVSIWATLAVFAGFFVSAPIFFSVNRSNYLLFALMFSAIFLVYYKDERRWVRELSYVALAVAAGIKLYPAAFALVLLRDKRFLDFGKVALYSICLVIFPFFAFKGGFVANTKEFFKNLFSWTVSSKIYANNFSNAYSADISVKNQFVMLCTRLTGTEPWNLSRGVHNTGLSFSVLITVAMVAVSLVSKSGWRRLSAMGLIITLFPSVSSYYSVTFMLIPFTVFLVDEKADKNKIAYWIFYIILLCPVSFGFFIKQWTCGIIFGYTLMHWLQGISMIAMSMMLFVEMLIGFIKVRKCKTSECTEV
ncbi:MAG: DUF2029 domain-containing protein [Clostridia bacterium]|nr:DUF2029 domain-containing protein [Clostridia bacterium]